MNTQPQPITNTPQETPQLIFSADSPTKGSPPCCKRTSPRPCCFGRGDLSKCCKKRRKQCCDEPVGGSRSLSQPGASNTGAEGGCGGKKNGGEDCCGGKNEGGGCGGKKKEDGGEDCCGGKKREDGGGCGGKKKGEADEDCCGGKKKGEGGGGCGGKKKEEAGEDCCGGKKEGGGGCGGKKKEEAGEDCCGGKKEEGGGCAGKKKKKEAGGGCATKASGCCGSKEANKEDDWDIEKGPLVPVKKEDTAKGGCCSGPSCSSSKGGTSINDDDNSTAQANSSNYQLWARMALFLSALSIFWNMGEAGSGIYLGYLHEQLSLITFGSQSLVEVISACLVLWRVHDEVQHPLVMQKDKPSARKIIQRERLGTRVIGALFIVFGISVVGDAVRRFVLRIEPGDTLPGLIISGASWFMMGSMFVLKRHASKVLNSSVLMQDAKCSLMCMMLGTVVIGSSLIWMFEENINHVCSAGICDIWWLDPSLACLLAAVIMKDGVKAIIASFSKDFQGGCGCCAGEKTPLIAPK